MSDSSAYGSSQPCGWRNVFSTSIEVSDVLCVVDFVTDVLLSTTIQSSISLPLDGSTIPSGNSSRTDGGSNIGAIAGGVAGGIVTALAVVAFLFFWSRRQRRLRRELENTVTPVRFILPSELSSPVFASTLSRRVPSSSSPYTTDSPSSPADKKALLYINGRSPISQSESSGASDADATAGTNLRTRPRASPPRGEQAQAIATVLRGALDEREHITREITNIRQELELLRRTDSYYGSEAPPSYAGTSPG